MVYFPTTLAQKEAIRQQLKAASKKDAYDLDPTTVSVYDDLKRHGKYDFYEDGLTHEERTGKVNTLRPLSWYAQRN